MNERNLLLLRLNLRWWRRRHFACCLFLGELLLLFFLVLLRRNITGQNTVQFLDNILIRFGWPEGPSGVAKVACAGILGKGLDVADKALIYAGREVLCGEVERHIPLTKIKAFDDL